VQGWFIIFLAVAYVTLLFVIASLGDHCKSFPVALIATISALPSTSRSRRRRCAR
jgi:hypothetical protein